MDMEQVEMSYRQMEMQNGTATVGNSLKCVYKVNLHLSMSLQSLS